jgi:predicted RNA methylase
MSQNTSHAVMAHRKEASDSLDFFPTPPWATRALCEFLKERHEVSDQLVWEPACGGGHMARTLAEYFHSVAAGDVHDYGQAVIEDFLWPSEKRADWIITNPPFRLGREFVLTALERARVGVAMLVRLQFLEGGERYHDLFAKAGREPAYILPFAERVPMVKGRVDALASTATAYCWIVWHVGEGGETNMHWIPPGTRKRLERDGDYA